MARPKKPKTWDDFSLSDDQQKEYNALEKGWQKAVFMGQAKKAFAAEHGLQYHGKNTDKKKQEAKEKAAKKAEEELEELEGKTAADLRREIRLYAQSKGYDALKAQIDMATEKDKDGNFVLNAKERQSIHKDMAKFFAPAYRSSDIDEENKSNVTVEVSHFNFGDQASSEVLPTVADDEYDEFEFIEENE